MATVPCPHCGNANPPNARFCNHCGAGLQPPEKPAPPPSSQTGTGEPVGGPAPAGMDPPAQAQGTDPADPGDTSSAAEQPSPDAEPQADSGPRPIPSQSSGLSRPRRPRFDEAAATLDRLRRRQPGQPGAPLFPDQPWLHPESDDADLATPPQPTPERLVTGLQGLLEPVDLADLLATVPQPVTPPTRVEDEVLRQLRATLGTEVVLADTPPALTAGGSGLLRHAWIYLLVGVALGLAVMVAGDVSPQGVPHQWPGVAEAHAAIEALSEQPVVLVNWAYDPATAGEMDLVVRPVIEQLLQRRSQLVIVSQLPGGPATARRLIDQAAAALRSRGELPLAFGRPGQGLVEGGFLPGGISALPLLGQAPAEGLPVDQRGVPTAGYPAIRTLVQRPPHLVLVVAAQARDVQDWLEQVQPLNRVPVVAVTSAGADPPLRPYWDSGQLAGLVSGFDGGIRYRQLLNRSVEPQVQRRLWRQISGQNWGFLVVLLAIVLGNLATIVGGQRS